MKSACLGSKYAAMQMMEQEQGGNIVNNSSVASLEGDSNEVDYCAAKGGVILLTKATTLDLAPSGILVNCICSGEIDTPMIGSVLECEERIRKSYLQSRPMDSGRVGTFRETANASSFPASGQSSFTTGSTPVVDGGRTAGTHLKLWASS